MRTSVPIVLALAASPSLAQLTVTAGPDPAPQGCPVSVSITNDTELIAGIFNCPFQILDEDLDVVFIPECFPIELLVGPLGTLTWIWDQTNLDGDPVRPGTYFVEMETYAGPVLVPVTVAEVETGLHLEGTPAIGTAGVGDGRHVVACSPEDPGGIHWVLASLSNDQGVATCGGVLPLDADPLFALSLVPDAILPGGLGFLDNAGYSDAVRLPIPDNESLIGLPLVLAFVVLDPASSCPIARVSDPLELVLQEGAIPFPG